MHAVCLRGPRTAENEQRRRLGLVQSAAHGASSCAKSAIRWRLAPAAGSRSGLFATEATFTDSSATIEVLGLSKRYEQRAAVDGLSFEVPAGQLLALVGESGS